MPNFDIQTNENIIRIDIRKYLAIIWHWSWLILLSGFMMGLITFFISREIMPVYEAKTTILVNDGASPDSSDYQSLLASELLTKTYAEMMTKSPILDQVIQETGLTMGVYDLGESITVDPLINTLLIDVVVESTNASTAVNIANTLVKVFIEDTERIQSERYAQSKSSLEEKLSELDDEIQHYNVLAEASELESEREEYLSRVNQYRDTYYSLMELYENVLISEAQSISSVVVVEPATISNEPVRPRILLNSVVVGLAGIFLMTGAFLAREAIDDTLQTPDDITNNLNLPILGVIEALSKEERQGLVTIDYPRNPISESFRSLRENIRFVQSETPLNTLLITSPEPGEGKSIVAANLAVVFAQAGIETALLDCDLRKPTLHTFFKINNQYGLSNLLEQDIQYPRQEFHIPVEKLKVVTSGALPPNPAELIGSTGMRNLLTYFKAKANLIILDTPPIQVVSDALNLASEVDGVVLVIQPGSTHASAARETIDQLRRIHAQILGVVLNPIFLRQKQNAYHHFYQNRRKEYQNYYQDVKNEDDS